MGCLHWRSKRRVGPSDIDFIIPKVKEVGSRSRMWLQNQDGTCAQFKPLTLRESISQMYHRDSLEHLPLGGKVLLGSTEASAYGQLQPVSGAAVGFRADFRSTADGEDMGAAFQASLVSLPSLWDHGRRLGQCLLSQLPPVAPGF